MFQKKFRIPNYNKSSRFQFVDFPKNIHVKNSSPYVGKMFTVYKKCSSSVQILFSVHLKKISIYFLESSVFYHHILRKCSMCILNSLFKKSFTFKKKYSFLTILKHCWHSQEILFTLFCRSIEKK